MSTAVTPPTRGAEPGTSASTTGTPVIDEAPVEHARTESREARTQRLSTGTLIAIVSVLLLWLLTRTHGTARFALSDAFAAVHLPTLALPGVATLTVCAVLVLASAAAFFSGRARGRWAALAGTVGGAAVIIGFLTWAASGRDLPFPVANQFNGTLQFATPLVLGALCGVFCERSGVVNVAIEGQMLSGAFSAALVGSLTHSLVAAFIGAVVASLLIGALLALFSIKYLVDQVVLGVVLNLLASGLTGYLFDQLVQPNAEKYNAAPVMSTVSIPGLSKIPFFGPVLFQQTVLAYLAFLAVPIAWFLLFRTKWGLRVRAVGEHPKAADTVGISVTRTRWQAVLAGAVFAGLGGAFFTLGSAGQFNKDLTVGNGFIALAALIMGRWRPGLAAVMALFFGFVQEMASQLQTINTPMPSSLLLILPYIATIIAVAGLVGRVRAPAADGVPYVSDHH